MSSSIANVDFFVDLCNAVNNMQHSLDFNKQVSFFKVNLL